VFEEALNLSESKSYFEMKEDTDEEESNHEKLFVAGPFYYNSTDNLALYLSMPR